MSALSAIVLTLGLSLALTRRAWTAAGTTAYFLATIELASWVKQSHQGMAMTLGDVHHTTGGGSWLTEFAFFSGFDWRAFGRGGRFAPISLAPRLRHSLPRTLRALGYRTIAIYPSEGEFLGAETAYGR